MTTWLINPDNLKPLEAAMARGIVPTAEQQIEFEAAYSDGEYPGSRIMAKAGSTAQIDISGTLTRQPSWIARWFGGGNTAYSEILSAVAEAERDPNIREIIISIDSPGGQTNGLVEVMDAIRDATKPTTAYVRGMACSAAYGIASQADKIVAENRGSMLGSVGVKVAYAVYPEVVEITSTNAPKKAPDVTTEDGKADVREMLDEIEAVFLQDIAAGRGVSVDTVKKDYGRGGVFLADNALKYGMIDEIQTARAATGGASTPTQEAKIMNLQELKAAHPGVYAEAVAEGVSQERDRVGAHLTMGEASGDMATAIKACKDGEAMTATLQATYMSAGMNKQSIAARAADDQTTATAATTPATPDAAEDDIENFAALMRNGG